MKIRERLSIAWQVWNFTLLVYLALSLLFGVLVLKFDNGGSNSRLIAATGLVIGALSNVFQILQRKPDGYLRELKYEIFMLQKAQSGSATWLNNRNIEIVEHQTEAIKNHIDKSRLTDRAKLEELSQAIERQPTEIATILNKTIENVLAQEHQEREKNRQIYQKEIKGLLTVPLDDKKVALRGEIALAFVRFRDKFEHTKEMAHIPSLNEIRLKILDLAQESEIYLQDGLQDFIPEIWSAFLELTIAISRSESKVLAPLERSNQWEDRIYGKRNSELYKQVMDCVEAVKQRFQPKPSDELSVTDMKILKMLWEYLKYEKIHGLLQGYANNRLHDKYLENIDIYSEYRQYPRYELEDSELEGKLKEFDKSLFMTVSLGSDIMGPTNPPSDYVAWDVFLYRLTQEDYHERKAKYDNFVAHNVTPTFQIYQEFIDLLKRRHLFQRLEWPED